MKIELKHIKVRDLFDRYVDNEEEGVKGYGGRLNIRPKYQREFVYKEKQRNAVIDTLKKGYPLNIFYWVKNNDNDFEVLDGQQRTISICRYIAGDFSFDEYYFANLPKDQRENILDYEIMVYFCEGKDSEKLEWFKTINIAGEPLTNQELRNAIYAGPWSTDAKRYFSKTGCAAYNVASDYMKGTPIRQDYLETALSWMAARKSTSIEDYMGKHQKDPNALELWSYFSSVMVWVKGTFTKYWKEMKGVEWGLLYNRYGNTTLDTVKLNKKIAELMADEDVTRKAGIFEYVLSGKESLLSIRTFSQRDKRTTYEKQNHKCCKCGKECSLSEMEADHITPWSKGGKTVPENCQMLCKDCNRRKSNR